MPVTAEPRYNRISLKQYAVIPVWYGCNSACTICMLASVKGRLETVDFDTFARLIAALVNDRRYDRLILSGAEATTFAGLETYVRHAASLGWFKTIQLQTNGRRLADRDYLERLVAAGVNEFFISVHGPAAIHDAITRVPGSHAATMTGIAHLAGLPVNVITNTVLTGVNLDCLAGLFGELAETVASEMHLWNFFPMAHTDRQDLLVKLSELMALFPAFAAAIALSGKALVLKGFPECIAPGAPCFADSDFPLNLIQDDFWMEFGRNGFGGCVHKERCAARNCWGLSTAYVEKYGDERALLRPLAGVIS